MPVDPYIARGGVPLDLTDTLVRGRALQQRDRSLDQDQQLIDFRQEQTRNALLAQEEDDAEWDEAFGAKDWTRMAAIDPQATRVLWEMEQAQQPQQPLTPPEVRQDGGYSYMFDPSKGVIPGSVQQPQRAPLSGGGEAPAQSPSYRDIIDPTNPKQMLTVDGKVYRGGGLGAPGVLGIAGKEPSAAKAEEKRGSGRESVEALIAELRDNFTQLNELGGVTNTERGALGNVSAGIRSSEVGQKTGKIFGTREQSIRNQIAMTRPRLLSSIMQATGMSARQLDSNAELKLWLSASTDPTLDIQANLAALENISRIYGAGSLPADQSAQGEQPQQRTTPENRVQRTEAPPSALEYLKAHPETKAAFFKKYGYLPNGR